MGDTGTGQLGFQGVWGRYGTGFKGRGEAIQEGEITGADAYLGSKNQSSAEEFPHLGPREVWNFI